MLCNTIDCNSPGSSVHGIIQARILEWVPCPPPRDLPNPGMNLYLLHWQVNSLPPSHWGSPSAITKTTNYGWRLLLRGFPDDSAGKKSSCQCRRHSCRFDPGLGKSPGEENGNLLQYSCWKIPWIEEAGGL